MATEELKLVIDDAELTAALAKIMTITNAQKQTTGDLRGLSTLIRDTRRDARAAGIQLDDLPTLNRDMRLIFGMVPGFRQASALLFQARRGVRAQQLKREAEALKAAGLAPGVAGELGAAALIGQAALVVFIVTSLVRTIQNIQQDVDRNSEQYERIIQEGLGISHKEYEEFMKTFEAQQQVGFESTFDRFFVQKMGTFRELVTVWVAEIIAQVGPFIAAPGEDATGVPSWVQGGMETEEWTSWGREQEFDPGD